MSLSLLGQWRAWHIFAEPEVVHFAIAGLSYEILADGLRQRAPQPARGAVTRTFSGRAISDTEGEVRAWQVAIYDLEPEAYAALRTAMYAGHRVGVTGRMLAGGGVILATVELQEGAYVWDGENFQMRPVLTITSVAPVGAGV